MKIFISHSSTDVSIAKSIITIIRSAVNLKAKDIRCTSVNGYRLPIGVKTDERLQKEIFESEVLIGIITPSSLNSHYVLFELGARWGQDLTIFPVICSESGYEILTGPLQGINSLDGTDETQLLQFVQDLAEKLNITPEPSHVFADEISELAKKCKAVTQDEPAKTDNIDEIIKHLKNETINLRGIDCTMLDILQTASKTLAYGAFRDDISQPLIKLTKKSEGEKYTSSYENEKVIGELMIFDLIVEKSVQGILHPKYYLTELGKELIKKIKTTT